MDEHAMGLRAGGRRALDLAPREAELDGPVRRAHPVWRAVLVRGPSAPPSQPNVSCLLHLATLASPWPRRAMARPQPCKGSNRTTCPTHPGSPSPHRTLRIAQSWPVLSGGSIPPLALAQP